MAVLTPIPAPVAAPAPAAAPSASGPACSLQRSGSLWQLGSEAQELTTAISQLAEQLETEEPEQRALAHAELDASLLAQHGHKDAPAPHAHSTRLGHATLPPSATYHQPHGTSAAP